MHLSRLTAFGFKSFAQKLDLSLQKGIICVVGPNGCGKSNVVDALRWALGEQRARSLRSNNMEDVIFAGSRTRKPLGMAEVSVTIDNSDRILPVDYTEVTITRRLFRSGESDYLLNKVPCRLKDIHDLLMDTGLGAHAYSVIEQGMVDEIISDKPEERRRLFEEAAGVTRYKVRRRSAWNKLQSIQLDLQRIDDIIGEVERQVTSLARQERKARLYKQLSDQLQDIEIQLARYRYFEMSDRARPMLEEMKFLQEDLEVGSSDISLLEARLEEMRTELTVQDQALATANAEVSRHVEAVHRKDREILVAREEARSIEGFLERATRQQEEMAERRQEAHDGQEVAEQTRTQVVVSLEQAEAALGEETESLESLTEDLEARREQADEQKSLLIATMRESSEKGGRQERGRAEIEGLAHRRNRLEEDVARVQARKQEADEAGSEAAREVETLEREVEERSVQRGASIEERSRLQAQQEELVEKRNQLRAGHEADGARLTMLQRLREGFEGYSRGVRALAVDSPFADRIRGVVADSIDVDSTYTAAVEAALGRALECLLVDGTPEAVEAMAYLRSGSHGSAAFLPLEWVAYEGGTSWTLPEGEGVLGCASDLVRGERAPVHMLLRNTLVVSSVDVAIAQMARMRAVGVDIVTLSGEVFAADGTVYGGAAAGEGTGLIGRAQEVEALEKRLAAGQAELEALDGEIRKTAEVLAEQVRQIEAAEGALASLRNRLAGLQRDRQNAQAEIERQTRAAIELNEEAQRLKEREAELKVSLEAVEAEMATLEARRTGLEEEARVADEALREQELQRRTRQDAVTARREEIVSLKARSEGLVQEAQRLAQGQVELARQMERLAEECATSEKRKTQLTEVVEAASGELGELHRVQAELEKKRDTQAQHQQELMTNTRKVEDELREKNRRVNQNRERLNKLQVEMAELKTRAEGLQERMQQEYELDLKEAGRLEDSEFNADITSKRVIEIQDRLRRMGSVNLAALEEYDVQKERYEFLAKQRDDLLEAEETLKRTISKIDRTARGRFMDTFNQIRENFHKTFEAFFEGGEADLQMPADEDPLEAPLQIIARPRGKRLQHINLLSGGERALTAISLLFAIYLVKPSPFCILDEVDAPLDDANVGRFVRVIQKFSEDTQFIVVTHNKGTMEAADCLHGVTMEEPGVSKLVSVRLGKEAENGQMEAALDTAD
ncbi:MAG: chromosome segregation protein SMC [bacterium]|nr:chromosome segregation protein SMC [bacterium]